MSKIHTQDKKLHIIIIGSGCTGLFIAQALKKREVSFSIHDKTNPADRHRDWSMTLFWSFRYYPHLLSDALQARIHEAQTKPFYRATEKEELVVRNAATGEALKKVNSPYAIRVHRRGLRNLLLDGIDVQYGHELVKIEYTKDGVIAHFSDGTFEEGACIVGADGGQSFVRRMLFGERAEPETFPQYEMANLSVKYTHEQGKYIAETMAPHVDYGVHPKGIFFIMLCQSVVDKDDYSTWTFHYVITFPKDLPGMPYKGQSNADRLRVLKSFADDFAEPRRSALKWMPEDQEVPNDSIKVWVPSQWDNHGGRVTLAGDAAHAISFHRGQGMNNATVDCAHFATAIDKVISGEETMATAITTYEKEVVDRGTYEAALSREQTLTIHHWDRFVKSPIVQYGGNLAREIESWEQKKAKADAGVKVTTIV
ncbi:fad nadp-binding domain-containing [Trichoderma arundinaceum]|uniref:Fad nadp-binding domain-containing n=1 Tax=Trichoderma arundinaceum TaxID=490622 RepID=A0A395NB94_TRIAR|nr:fad nadp-binding domain-containing [Trichoderma arundinaceum]